MALVPSTLQATQIEAAMKVPQLDPSPITKKDGSGSSNCNRYIVRSATVTTEITATASGAYVHHQKSCDRSNC